MSTYNSGPAGLQSHRYCLSVSLPPSAAWTRVLPPSSAVRMINFLIILVYNKSRPRASRITSVATAPGLIMDVTIRREFVGCVNASTSSRNASSSTSLETLYLPRIADLLSAEEKASKDNTKRRNSPVHHPRSFFTSQPQKDILRLALREFGHPVDKRPRERQHNIGIEPLRRLPQLR